MKAVKCGKLYDPASGVISEGKVILIDGSTIADIIDFVPKNAEVIDLSDKFVMPGLIDSHIHMSADAGPASYDMSVYRTAGDVAYAALPRVMSCLKAGFTTVRDAGCSYYVDVAMKKAIEAGYIQGPNLMVAGECIGSTGSHADDHFSPYISNSMAAPTMVDNPDDCRKAVRYNLKHGADFIKIMATGGVMSRGTTIGAQQFTYEEMKAVADTCKMYGVHSAAHCHGTSGIKDAARAGITSIEHATMLDDECIEIMLKNGTYIVPTFIAPEMIIVNGSKAGMAPWMVEKAVRSAVNHAAGVYKAFKAGVNIAFGTDAGTPFNFHGKQTYEFELMVRAGFTPAEALKAATVTAAKLLGMTDRVGSIEKGKLADIVAYDASPLDDIRVMNNCAFVMSRGMVI